MNRSLCILSVKTIAINYKGSGADDKWFLQENGIPIYSIF